jgi:hypothetical protein
MAGKVSSWTMFGSRAWNYDLTYKRRLLFMEILKSYEKSGVEPPYSLIRAEVLDLSYNDVEKRIEELKTKTVRKVPLIDTLMVEDVSNEEE